MILKLAEVRDCNDSMRRVVVILLMIMMASPLKRLQTSLFGNREASALATAGGETGWQVEGPLLNTLNYNSAVT